LTLIGDKSPLHVSAVFPPENPFGARFTGGCVHRKTRLDEGKNFLTLPEMAHDSSVA
jgi:hypothetical protein